MDALTPLQCFVIGAGGSLLGCSALWFLGWRQLVRLRERDPDFVTRITEEARRKREQKALLERESVQLRRREVELLERVAANQDVMIGLLRQSLDEKVMTPG